MIPYVRVHELLESYGWMLKSIHSDRRVFYLNGDPRTGLPIIVRVQDKSVDEDDFEKIKAILEYDPQG